MNIIRIILILLGVLLLSLGLQLLVYGVSFTYEHVSNVMFVLGVITFLSSLIMVSGSYEIFYGFRYSMRSLFTKDFRKHYPTFLEFKTEKEVPVNSSVFIDSIIASTVVIVVAIILARMAIL